MRIGLSSPVVVQVPGIAGIWEHDASIAELASIAATADELDYEFLTCSEHIAVPSTDAAVRGSVYWDPLSTLGFLAARTSRIRLATAVVVLGYHHPLELAKRYGTLDQISSGRLILGVGIGSLAEEFALLGAQFDHRGARADDALRALRSSLSTSTPAYQGSYYAFSDMTVLPHAVQARVPIWIGGRSRASLRRAVELGDGWMPFGLDDPTVTQLISDTDLPGGFDIVLGSGRPLDPEGDAAATHRRLIALRNAGATVVNCTVTGRSAEHYSAQLHTLKAIADTID